MRGLPCEPASAHFVMLILSSGKSPQTAASCASTSRRCSSAHPMFRGTSGRHPLGFIFPCFCTAFCASNVPWNFREASVSIHFIISYIDCHELCRVTKSQGRWDWRGWKSDRILSLTGLGVYFFLSRPVFLPWAGLEAYFSFPRPGFRTWLFKMVDIISIPGSSCLFSHSQTRLHTKTIQTSLRNFISWVWAHLFSTPDPQNIFSTVSKAYPTKI